MADYVIPRDEWAVFYRQSVNKRTAIEVLRDVTLLTRKEIEDALISDGCEVKRRAQYNPNGCLDREKALELYEQGMTDPEIADFVGVNKTTIWCWRNENKLPVNEFKRKDSVSDEIERLYRQGCNDVEIAQQVGRKTPAIWKWRQRRGLPPNGIQGKVAKNARANATSD